MDITLTATDLQRFWSKVRRGCGKRCWVWTAGKSGGYGTIYISGLNRKAHRVSYLIHYGSVEDQVLHKCDNPSCVRPDHLFPGDQKANMMDMAAKGRSSRLRGALNGNSRLTEPIVAQIKAVLGRASQMAIAGRFGCSQQTISNIATGRGWDWVEADPDFDEDPDDW